MTSDQINTIFNKDPFIARVSSDRSKINICNADMDWFIEKKNNKYVLRRSERAEVLGIDEFDTEDAACRALIKCHVRYHSELEKYLKPEKKRRED